MLDEATKELIAIGASVTAHCQPCLDYHVSAARQLGISDENIQIAVDVGKQVRRGAASAMDKKITETLATPAETCASTGCGCH